MKSEYRQLSQNENSFRIRNAMKFEITFFVVLLLWCAHHLRAVEEQHNEAQRENLISENEGNNITHECHQFNKDYRNYIKCLKREKRQHYGSHIGLDKRACFDECSETKCSTSACIHDCHARCKKRLIETYSKTVETSFDCDGDSCPPAYPLPNITLNLNLTNTLPNISVSCVKNSSKEHCTDRGDVVNITNVINNINQGSNCPYPGCIFYPPPQLPQITIDFNSRPIGGCPYPPYWPCFHQPQITPIDCSICANPLFRQQCDPSCTSDPQRNTPTNTQKPNSQSLSNNYYRNNY